MLLPGKYLHAPFVPPPSSLVHAAPEKYLSCLPATEPAPPVAQATSEGHSVATTMHWAPQKEPGWKGQLYRLVAKVRLGTKGRSPASCSLDQRPEAVTVACASIIAFRLPPHSYQHLDWLVTKPDMPKSLQHHCYNHKIHRSNTHSNDRTPINS